MQTHIQGIVSIDDMKYSMSLAIFWLKYIKTLNCRTVIQSPLCSIMAVYVKQVCMNVRGISIE